MPLDSSKLLSGRIKFNHYLLQLPLSYQQEQLSFLDLMFSYHDQPCSRYSLYMRLWLSVKPAPEPIKVQPAEPVLASLATLKDIEQQRNPKRVVDVKVSKPAMKIGKDSLDLSIKSSHDGYIYMILLGSDAKSFYVLYPNGLDKNNAIKAGQTVRIPKPDWEVKAAGPVGTNNLLVMVSDSPRKLSTLTMAEPTAAEPFTYALNDIGGRSALINFLTSSGTDGKSESFGAKLVAIKEVK